MAGRAGYWKERELYAKDMLRCSICPPHDQTHRSESHPESLKHILILAATDIGILITRCKKGHMLACFHVHTHTPKLNSSWPILGLSFREAGHGKKRPEVEG
jgi:hypothetical protein